MADIADRDAAILAALARVEAKLDAIAAGAMVLDASAFSDMADPDLVTFEQALHLRNYAKATLQRRLEAEYGTLGIKDGGRWRISRRVLMAPAP